MTGRFIITVVTYLFISLLVVSLWHFVLFKKHYHGITIVRKEPLMLLGIASMIIQGCVLAFLYPVFYQHTNGSDISKGIKFGLLMALFLGTYLSLAEAGKYEILSVLNWILIEGALSITQFTLVGVALGLIYSRH